MPVYNFPDSSAFSSGEKATWAGDVGAALNSLGLAQDNGTVWLDSFQNSGGTLTDDQLLDAALSYAAAQTYRPIILFGRTGNKYVFATGNRVPYDGMRFKGPGQGEYVRSSFSPLQVQLTFSGKAWFVAPNGTDTSCVSMEDMNVYGNEAGYFLASGGSTANWQQLKLHDVCLNSFKMWLGGPATTDGTELAFRTTASQLFSGQSNLGNVTGKYGLWLAGSDSKIFGDGALVDTPNSVGNGGANSGRYMVYCNYLSRSLIGRVYVTAENYGGILIDGSAASTTTTDGHEYGHGLILSHVELQGRSEGLTRDTTSGPNNGALLRMNGGEVTLDHINVSWGMSSWNGSTCTTSVNTGDRGYIHQTGGRLLADGVGFAKTLSPLLDETVPMIYRSGGELRVVNARKIGPWTGNPQVHGASNSTDGSWTAV